MLLSKNAQAQVCLSTVRAAVLAMHHSMVHLCQATGQTLGKGCQHRCTSMGGAVALTTQEACKLLLIAGHGSS